MTKNGKELSPTERKVAEALLSGMSNQSIGKQLGVSARTIDGHRGNIMSKTGAQSAVQLGFILGSMGIGKPLAGKNSLEPASGDNTPKDM